MKKAILVFIILVISAGQLVFSQEQSEKYKRAEELTELGMYPDATKLLEELCVEDPGNFLYFQDLGWLYLNQFDYDAAIKTYTKATEINPACFKCYSHIARAYYEKSDYAKAESIIAKGFAISDTTAHLYMTRGLIYQRTNRGALALSDFNIAIKLTPEDDDLYIVRANYYLEASEAYNAYSDISSAIKIDPANPDYYYYRAYILTNLKVHDEALIDIEKAINLKNNFADYYNLKFTIHMNRGEFDLAEQAVMKSIEIKPNDHFAYVSLGDLYMQIGDMDRYCECYQKAIELHPDDNSENKSALITSHGKYCNNKKMPYYFVRALGRFNDNNFGECISITEAGINAVGKSAVLYNLKATSHLSRQEYELAEIDFNNCIANKAMLVGEVKDFYSYPINDTDAKRVAESYNIKSDFGLAAIKLVMREYDPALIYIIKALASAETIDDFDGLEFLYNTKAMIYLAKDDMDNALKNLKIADEKNPYNSISKLNIALISVLKNCKYNKKKLVFIYVPEMLFPRLELPALKLNKDYNADELKEAMATCDQIISIEPENAYAYLLKAKIAQLLNQTDYCEYANMAKEYGIFNAFKELKIKCE